MYPKETLDPRDDNGVMPENVETLANAVIGHRISGVLFGGNGTLIVLDNGHTVRLRNTSDCCAYTELEKFLLHPNRVGHVIAGVGTTDEYSTWHIYADAGDIVELTVGWSCGNLGYYVYGFDIEVVPFNEEQQ